jgi:cardiolipin synthase
MVIVILAQQALHWVYPPAIEVLIYAVLLTTVASGGHYLWTWLVIKQVEPLKKDDG